MPSNDLKMRTIILNKTTMKAFIMSIACLGFYGFSYAQHRLEEESMKPELLPELVIKNISKDFSAYLPDDNPDLSVKNIQEKFAAYDLGKDYEGYSNYLVVMKCDKGKLSASYDENGKLTSVVEKYTNVKLPNEVIYSVYHQFPGWEFVNDKYLYTQKKGDIVNKQYQIQIKKDGKTLNLKVHPNGQILTQGRMAQK